MQSKTFATNFILYLNRLNGASSTDLQNLHSILNWKTEIDILESEIPSYSNGKLNAENGEIYFWRDFTLKIETLFEIADT